ncbi:MAG: hypothetical protein CVT98_10015, partial [Bacteroidetes bacterium HGW-Bacteroidetes-15]
PISGFSDTTYTKGKSRDLVNFFADHTLYFKSLIISAGGLMAYNDDFGTNWNYGFDISLRLLKQLSMFSSVNNSIRLPTFTDLYYNGPTNQGNINLKPEKSNNYELGLKHHTTWYNAKVTLFHRIGKDVIDWVREAEDEIWTTKNHTQINTTGIECFLYINTEGRIPLINSISAGYHYMINDKESDTLLSYYALDYLKHKATMNITHSILSKLTASWSANWQAREGTYTEYPSNNEVAYEPFFLFNVRTKYEINSLNVFVDINNLLNKKYSDLGNIPQSGRWISIGLNYKLE